MSSPKTLGRTADRRGSPGELHQALAPLLPGDDRVLLIPAARHEEQARLEAEVFLGLRAVGGLSAHPLGIVRLRPEGDRLTIRVTDAPYVVMCWADQLLRRSTGEPSGSPRDLITGVPGLRYHRDRGGVHLHRPGVPARITLTGFPARWWDRITDRMHRNCDGRLLQPHPCWAPGERAAYDIDSGWPFPPGPVFSPLLRRIRATAGPGRVNSTDAWSSDGGYRMEATDGPPCPELIRLLGSGPPRGRAGRSPTSVAPAGATTSTTAAPWTSSTRPRGSPSATATAAGAAPPTRTTSSTWPNSTPRPSSEYGAEAGRGALSQSAG